MRESAVPYARACAGFRAGTLHDERVWRRKRTRQGPRARSRTCGHTGVAIRTNKQIKKYVKKEIRSAMATQRKPDETINKSTIMEKNKKEKRQDTPMQPQLSNPNGKKKGQEANNKHDT